MICRTNRLLCFFFFFLPIALLSILISYLLYQDEKEHQYILHRSYESYSIAHQQKSIRKLFLNITSDLEILAGLYQEYLNRGNAEEALGEFAETLRLFSQHRQVYDQIRLLDPQGMEQIRVNLIAGQSILLAKEYLKPKDQRYYFKDTIKLDPGEIFISPFDLNVEQG
ncbi:MAG: hypothetical protein D3923_15215, partial [Candidatus Electrothrix sp. AR3]|nr:hypothetical protein [Candidatus Electrothrix sp. AR3]